MKEDILLKFFPIPEFLKRSVTGLDISTDGVRFVEFKKTNNGIMNVGRFGNVSIKNGVVLSDGTISDSEYLKKILKKIKKDYNLEFVHVSFPEKSSYLFTTQIPDVKNIKDKEIRSNLEFQLEEYVPLTSEGVVFDYNFIKKKYREVVVSVAPKNIVYNITDIVERSGMVLYSLQTEAQAIARAVIPKNDSGLYTVVDFGKSRTIFFIVEDGTVLFSTIIDIGGDDLVKVIQKNLGVSFIEAERIKKEKGISKTKLDSGLFFALLSVISAVRDEINKYNTYWQTKSNKDKVDKNRNIEKIFLCGESAGTTAFREHLSVGLNIPIEMSNVWVNAFSIDEYIPPISLNDSLGFATAIGLALSDDI